MWPGKCAAHSQRAVCDSDELAVNVGEAALAGAVKGGARKG